MEGTEGWGTVIVAAGHQWVEVQDESTSEYIVKQCSVCGVKVKQFSGTHTLLEVPAVEPTCNEPGNKAYYECICNNDTCQGGRLFADQNAFHEITPDEFEAEYLLEALGHDYVETEYVAPTCTMFGTEAGEVCSRCGEPHPENGPEKIPALGHDWKFVDEKEATCTEDGNNAYAYCDREGCGEYKDGIEKVIYPKTGHNMGPMIYTAPTCTENGSNVRKCQNARCTYEEVTVLTKLGHDMKLVPAKAATCTVAGNEAYYECTREGCGLLSSDAAGEEAIANVPVIAAPGHSMKTETVDPTCTEGGYTITYCENSDTQTVKSAFTEALGHIGGSATCKDKAVCERCHQPYGGYGEHTYLLTTDFKGDCQNKAYKEYTCDVCGKVKKETGKLGDHVWVDITVEPTCTTAGSMARECEICGANTTVEIPALGHNVQNWTVENSVATGTCSRCGETFTANPAEVIPGYTANRCPKCNLVHEGRTGIFVQDGLYCKVIGFFRSIINFIKNLF